MKFCIIISVFLIFITASANAFTTSQFQGKLHNLTGISNNSIKIHFSINCSYIIIVDQYHCGNKEVSIPINSDGSYSVPSLSLTPGPFKEKYIETYFKVTINDKEIYSSITTEPSCWHDPKCNFLKAKSMLINLSLIQLPKVDIKPIFTSGIEYKLFYNQVPNKIPQLGGILSIKSNNGNFVSLNNFATYQPSEDLPFTYNYPILLFTSAISENELFSFELLHAYTGCGRRSDLFKFQYSLRDGYMQNNTHVDNLEIVFNDQHDSIPESCSLYENKLTGNFRVFITPHNVVVEPGEQYAECFYDAILTCDTYGNLAGELRADMLINKVRNCPLKSSEELPVSGSCSLSSQNGYFNFSENGVPFQVDIMKKSVVYLQNGKDFGEINIRRQSTNN